MKKLALATLSAAALLASGCIIDADDDLHRQDFGPTPTDRYALVFTVTFAGADCAATPAVDRIRIRLEGTRTADETVLCPPAGTGREFSLPAGTYTWRIDGLAPDGAVLFAGTGVTDLVDRDVTVAADLVPVGGPTEEGTLTFFWTFAGQDCATAGVTQVRVTIPDLFDEAVPCATEGVEGIAIEPLPAGATEWTLQGQDAAGTPLFEAAGTSTVPAGDEVQETVDLAAVGAGG